MLTADPLDTQVSLRQLYLEPERVNDADAAAKFEAGIAAVEASDDATCAQVAQYAENAGASPDVEIGVLRLRDLSPELRNSIDGVDNGKPGTLVKLTDGWRMLFVCQRQDAVVQEPDFDQIYGQIEQQRLSMMGRRYLRDLRRDAIIDYR